MKRISIFILLVLFSLSLTACSFFRKNKVEISNDKQSLYFDGTVVMPEKITGQAGLLMIPFKAGPGVAATNNLDRLSLYIVKSISDCFKDENIGLRILSSAETKDADLVLKGYIVNVDEPKGIINKFRKKKNQLETKGQIIDIKTGEIVVDFSSSIYSEKRENLNELARQTGKAIANFILDHIGEK
ncbi:MAG: hypothetical protein PHY73_07580 [Candidatus Omnitrophica bacterium]|nr:hypothetical protein [Candidatus Omnitrophota bacterium]